MHAVQINQFDEVDDIQAPIEIATAATILHQTLPR